MSGQFKIGPDSSRYVWTAQNISEQPKMCPDRPDIIRYVQMIQNLSGQLKICLDSPKSALKCIIYICEKRLHPFSGLREMITHCLGMSRKIFTHFSSGRFLGATWKIQGFQTQSHPIPSHPIHPIKLGALCLDVRVCTGPLRDIVVAQSKIDSKLHLVKANFQSKKRKVTYQL